MDTKKMKLSIELNPVVTKDEETGMFIAKFADIPNAVAFDENPEQAVLRLISIFEVLLKEQKELIFEKIIKKHIEQAMKDEPSYELIRIQGVNNTNEKMKLQMVS